MPPFIRTRRRRGRCLAVPATRKEGNVMRYRPVRLAPPKREEVVALTTKTGTHTFRSFDRLWVQGEPRPVNTLHPGDLVAFLGRVLSVRLVTESPMLDAEQTA